MGEGGAREVMWATGLGENAWAAVGELCPSKPRAGAGGVGRRDPEGSHRAPWCAPCWAGCRLCPQQDTEMRRATPPHRVHQGPALSSRCPSVHRGGSTGGILQVLLRLRIGLKRGTCPKDTGSSPRARLSGAWGRGNTCEGHQCQAWRCPGTSWPGASGALSFAGTERVRAHGPRLSCSVAVGSDPASSRACAQGEPGAHSPHQAGPRPLPSPGKLSPGPGLREAVLFLIPQVSRVVLDKAGGQPTDSVSFQVAPPLPCTRQKCSQEVAGLP